MPSEDLAGASCSIPIHPQPQPLTLLARLTPAHIASVACPVPSTPALCLNTSTGHSASHKPPEATAFRCPLPGRRRRRGPDYAQLHGHRRASGDDGQVLPRVRRPDDFLSDVRASTILPLGYMHVSYMHVSRKFVDYDLDAGAAPETRQIEERDTIREIRSRSVPQFHLASPCAGFVTLSCSTDSMPPRPPRLLFGELTDNQRGVVMALMTGCFAALGFMLQTKLDERWGSPQEVRTPP